MHRTFNVSIRAAMLLSLAALFLFSLIFSFSLPMTAQAQDPTATPNDPFWRAYSAARDAIEEKFSVDLTQVQSYEWSQAEFVTGIDSCVDLDDPNTGRPVYFGWVFTLTSFRNQTYQARVSYDIQDVAACDHVDEASAPAAPAAPDGSLPPPVAGSAATGGFELGGHALEMSLGTFNLMRRARMTWVKQQVDYNLGDDAGETAGLIQTAHGSGFKILLSVRGHRDQMGNYSDYINQFAGYLGGVAGLGADAIEVWNEPNIDREWPAATINGATYTQMLAAAYNSIKSANGSTIVVSAAPAPTGFFGAGGCGSGGCNDDVFMQQMAAAGAASYMDCVGLHYNEGIIPPSAGGGDPRGGYPTYFFSSMLARGYNPFGGKPVCFTELGYLSPDGYDSPLPSNFGWAANTSVAEHASWLAEAAALAAQSGHVRLMIVWNVDFPFYTATDPMGGYAMFRPDQSCPACDSLATVMGG